MPIDAAAVRIPVLLGYRLDGDTRVVTQHREVLLRRTATGWSVLEDRAELLPGEAAEIWDDGPPQVAVHGRAVVVAATGALSADELRDLAATADRAAGRVDEVWESGWRRPVVLLVPRDRAQALALLGESVKPSGSGLGGRSKAALDRLAAITSGQWPTTRAGSGQNSRQGSGAADRVVVLPAGYLPLTAQGRAVVLGHELAHVAAHEAGSGAVPLWLQEGLAQYVGYRQSGVADRVIAADALVSAQGSGVPIALPVDDDFASTSSEPGRPGASGSPTRLDVAYAQAWLAVMLLVRAHGERAVVDDYRCVATGCGMPAAFGPSQVLAAVRAWLTTNG